MKSCKTCRWVGCRNYGWENRPTCISYIPEPPKTNKKESAK